MTKLKTSQLEWDLTPLLKSPKDPQIKKYRQEVLAAVEKFETKWREHTGYLTNPAILAQAVSEYEAVWKLPVIANDIFYFELASAKDSLSNDIKAGLAKAEEFYQEIMNRLRFFELNVSKIESRLQDKYLISPELSGYKHWLECLFDNAKYRLSEKEENILTLKSTPSHNLWVKLTSDQLSSDSRKTLKGNGKREEVALEELLSLLNHTDQKVRDEAAGVFNQLLQDHLEVATAELNAVLANKKIDDELRGYQRVDQDRLQLDDIDGQMIDTLLKTVSEKNELAHRYYELKAKLLGKDKLAYHERNVSVSPSETEYSYDQARKLVSEVFASLDPEFGQIFDAFEVAGQIDVLPKKGKAAGAFCASLLPHHPVYVLLNFTSRLRDVSTIAHEMGHALHAVYTAKAQSPLNIGHSMATAEVASTFMEDFVFERLMADASQEEQLALRFSRLGDDVSTIFRQNAFYRFEWDLHNQYRERGYLPATDIGSLFQKHMKDYMGPYVEQSFGSENWWTYVPHFRNFFYVYSYASGLLISKALQHKVRQDHREIEKIKFFLQSGRSKSPAEQFKELGLDVNDPAVWQSGLYQIKTELDLVEKLAQKLGRI